MKNNPPIASSKELAARIRRSRVLDPVLKRQWLRLLPHLSLADRARLLEILDLERTATPPPDPAR